MERHEVIDYKCMGLVKGEFHWSLYALAFLYSGKKWREVFVTD